MPFFIVCLNMICRYGCRLRMRWNCRIQGPDKRNSCFVRYLVPSVSCSNAMLLYYNNSIQLEIFVPFKENNNILLFYTSSVAPLEKKEERLSSCSLPAICIPRYLTPVKNFLLSYVILYIIFPFSPECTLGLVYFLGVFLHQSIVDVPAI